jgi:hypothetical protein
MSGHVVSDIQTFIYPIQHRRECCNWLVKRLDENVRILEKIELKVYVNQHENM